MVGSPVEAFQLGVWMHRGHVRASGRHCERRIWR
jgi:hypothetical protein